MFNSVKPFPSRKISFFALGFLFFASSAQAQQAGQGSTSVSGGGTSQAAPSLEAAYKKEFTFLAEQKRDLQKRLAQFNQRSKSELQQTQRAIESLESRLLDLETRTDALKEQVSESARQAESNEDNQQILDATFEQASASLRDRGSESIERDAFSSLSKQEQVAAIFNAGRDLIKNLSQTRRTEGDFFLADGTKTQGTIVYFGDVAAYGITENAAGALAPAGGGKLKLWEQPASQTARLLVQGEQPSTLKIFLYESLTNPIDADGEEGVLSHINSGGAIAWIIMGLGALALLLILARALFLQRASTSTSKVQAQVGQLVTEGKLDQALQQCKRFKGSSARVVAAAIRNLDRDRAHLEDIISESILNESGHLNRFGAIILVIAAVSPLLGLLGTVTGMITTFDVITKFGTGDPKLLSGGISTALVTTELGLAVAIPALLLGNLLSGWSERIKDDMEKAALRITNLYYNRLHMESTERNGDASVGRRPEAQLA